FPWPLLFA
ncbi:5-methyltetrahydrofolate--homocysteine methyltransferase, partial [Candidatus Hakubella thermalkaliphila]